MIGVLLLVSGMLFWLYYLSGVNVFEFAQREPLQTPYHQAQPSAMSEVSTEPTSPQADSEQGMPTQLPEQAMRDMADTQQAILQYPQYSQPYQHIGQALESWNQAYPVTVPVLNGDAQMALHVAQYYFLYPEPITGEIVSSVAIDSARIELVDNETQNVLYHTRSDGTFRIRPEESWPRELRLLADVRFQGVREQLSADLQLQVPQVFIEEVDAARIEGTDMTATVHLRVEQAGIVRLRGVLADGNGERLAVLTAQEHVGQGNQSIQLKAHHSVLPSEPVELYFMNPVIERMSSHPGELQSYGVSEQSQWPLGCINPSMLDTTPHQPSDAEQRQLEFLQNWGG